MQNTNAEHRSGDETQRELEPPMPEFEGRREATAYE
jgi:hypothetical protein